MKKFFILFLVLISFSCSNTIKETTVTDNLQVVTFDNCEYVITNYSSGGYSGYGYMAHKGNCKYCTKRRETEKINCK